MRLDAPSVAFHQPAARRPGGMPRFQARRGGGIRLRRCSKEGVTGSEIGSVTIRASARFNRDAQEDRPLLSFFFPGEVPAFLGPILSGGDRKKAVSFRSRSTFSRILGGAAQRGKVERICGSSSSSPKIFLARLPATLVGSASAWRFGYFPRRMVGREKSFLEKTGGWRFSRGSFTRCFLASRASTEIYGTAVLEGRPKGPSDAPWFPSPGKRHPTFAQGTPSATGGVWVERFRFRGLGGTGKGKQVGQSNNWGPAGTGGNRFFLRLFQSGRVSPCRFDKIWELRVSPYFWSEIFSSHPHVVKWPDDRGGAWPGGFGVGPPRGGAWAPPNGLLVGDV